MILTCPSCSTRYQADSARFAPPGRNVRCAKCSHVWFQAAPEHELEPEPERVIAPPEPAPAIGASHSPLTGAPPGGFGAEPADDRVFPADEGASVQYRQAIANLWPPSASIYAVIGMPVNVRGIALVDVAYQQAVEDGQQVLSVSGKVVNISDRELPVPVIRVVLTDQAKRELYHWTFDVGVPTLKPGGQSPFVTRLSSPPPDARNVDIRFAEAGEAQ